MTSGYHSRVTADSPYAVFRIRNFRLYVSAVIMVTLATMIQGTIVGWQVYDLTHDPLALGQIGRAHV